MIEELKENQIFVFGSNTVGYHLGGAAKQAIDDFGAIWGKGEGLQGKSYAFPTLNSGLQRLKISRLKESRDKLYKCCQDNPDKEFLLTKVGCGIAGFKEEQIKRLFKNCPNNLVLPADWQNKD